MIVENMETHILRSVTCLRKLCRLFGKVEKHNTTGKATDENKMHAHFTLGTQGYKNPLKEYVIFVAFPLQKWMNEHALILRYT
jgi:hypothetical protein